MSRDWVQSKNSVTLKTHPTSIFGEFRDVVRNAPYITSWSEHSQLEEKGEETIRYRLEFPESLEVTDQVFSSVAVYCWDGH